MGIINFLSSIPSHKQSYDLSSCTISKEISAKEIQCQKEQKEPLWKCRYLMVLIGFFIYFFLNAYRITTSVNIVAMVNSSAINQQTKGESVSCPNLIRNSTDDLGLRDAQKEGVFIWPPQIQGYILSSYFFGYVAAPIPIGRLVERFGCKWFLFSASFIAAVGTLLVPVFSWLSAYALIALQTVRGLSQGLIPPSMTILTANWFPKQERGFLFTIIQSGAALGSCLGSVFAGLLCESPGGWPSSFYTFGVAGLLLSACILYFIVESPKVHRNISKAELNFILSNQESTLARRRPNPPWRKIVSSVPVYAAGYGCFGQLWAISQFMLVHSTFLGNILHYPIAENGLFSAVPFLLQFLCSQIAGWFSSYMLKKNYAGVDFLRKFCNLVSCVGYSACLLGIYFAGCNRNLSTAFSILSTGFTGFGFAGSFIVAADMSPTFAGSMMAICCTSACMSSVILPNIVGYLTEEMQTIEQWNKVFFITIGVVLSSGIVFAVFGSAEVQPWNYVEEDDLKKEERRTDEDVNENKVLSDSQKNINIVEHNKIKITRF